MCAREFVIGKYYIFHIIVNIGFLFSVMTGQALLMSPKERNASTGMVSSNYERGLLLFAILLLCEITTSFA